MLLVAVLCEVTVNQRICRICNMYDLLSDGKRGKIQFFSPSNKKAAPFSPSKNRQLISGRERLIKIIGVVGCVCVRE